jgi:hypothetical protein
MHVLAPRQHGRLEATGYCNSSQKRIVFAERGRLLEGL